MAPWRRSDVQVSRVCYFIAKTLFGVLANETAGGRPAALTRLQTESSIRHEFDARNPRRLIFSQVNYLDRITYNPAQCGGRPCIRGMRMRVKDVLDLLAADVPEAEILADYPDLEAEDIKACLQYAAAQADHAVFKVA